MEPIQLLALADQARKYAYCPYSRFAVGAALLCDDGEVVTGCNVENASYPLGNCAERTAVFSALAKGKQKFLALAVCGGPKEKSGLLFCPPCGACRQVLREFCKPEFCLYLAAPKGQVYTFTLSQLLPFSFGPEELTQGFLTEGDQSHADV